MEAQIRVLDYPAGATVVLQDSKNDGFFYLVKSGQLEVTSEYELDNKEVSLFDPGETFGLVSALTGKVFLGTVRALRKSTVVQIPLQKLGYYLKTNRTACIKMIRSYSQELRSLDRTLAADEDRNYHTNEESLYLDAEIYLKNNLPRLAAFAYSKFLDFAQKNPSRVSRDVKDKAEKQLAAIDPDYRYPAFEGNHLSLPAGEPVFLENESSDYFYIVTKGAVKISRLHNDHEFILAILRAGEIFGELSILEEKNRMASAIAHSDIEVMRLSKHTFVDEVGEKILQKMFESMARRIWYMHQRLSIMSLEDAAARVYSHLYMLLSDRKMRAEQTEKLENVEFDFSVDDLKKMVAVMDSEETELITFYSDPNIVKGDKSLIVIKEDLLLNKLYFFRKKSRRNIAKNFF